MPLDQLHVASLKVLYYVQLSTFLDSYSVCYTSPRVHWCPGQRSRVSWARRQWTYGTSLLSRSLSGKGRRVFATEKLLIDWSFTPRHWKVRLETNVVKRHKCVSLWRLSCCECAGSTPPRWYLRNSHSPRLINVLIPPVAHQSWRVCIVVSAYLWQSCLWYDSVELWLSLLSSYAVRT